MELYGSLIWDLEMLSGLPNLKKLNYSQNYKLTTVDKEREAW